MEFLIDSRYYSFPAFVVQRWLADLTLFLPIVSTTLIGYHLLISTWLNP